MNPSMNPSIDQLRDIHLPPPISWWPPAPGWLILIAALATVFAALAWHLLRRRHRNRWRRSALRQLERLRTNYDARESDAQASIAALSVLLRQVALHRFARKEVAGLNGDAWLSFLDATLGEGPAFMSDGARALAVAPYLEDARLADDALHRLFVLSERWFRKLPAGEAV